MRIIVLGFILLICSLNSESQNIKNFSLEFEGNYFQNFMDQPVKRNYHYGFSAIGSKYFNIIKLSAGINYSIREYYTQDRLECPSPYRRNYKINYLNIPVNVNIGILSRNDFSLSVSAGCMLSNAINYNVQSINLTDGSSYRDSYNKNKFAATVNAGFSIIKPVNDRIFINVSPLLAYKFGNEFSGNISDQLNLPEDRFYMIIKIGIEYLFYK